MQQPWTMLQGHCSSALTRASNLISSLFFWSALQYLLAEMHFLLFISATSHEDWCGKSLVLGCTLWGTWNSLGPSLCFCPQITAQDTHLSKGSHLCPTELLLLTTLQMLSVHHQLLAILSFYPWVGEMLVKNVAIYHGSNIYEHFPLEFQAKQTFNSKKLAL